MGTTNFDVVDASGGFKVGGTEVIDSSGNLTATAGSVGNAELGVPKITVYQETVAFGDFTDGGGAAGTLDLSTTIPAGAVFLRCMLDTLTGFAGDTSATITVGDGTDVDRYNTGTPDVFSDAAAGVDMGAPSGTQFHSAAKTPKLTITSNADWGSVSAGAATVTLFYYETI